MTGDDGFDLAAENFMPRPATPEELAGLPTLPPSPRCPASASNRARLTVSGGVCHQVPGEQPLEVPVRFSRWLESDQDAYHRPRLRVGTDWQLIETGWVKGNPTLLAVANREAPSSTEGPPRVVEVGVMVDVNLPAAQRTMHSPHRVPPVIAPLFVIRPGESQAWLPAPGSIGLLVMRCATGEARVSLAVVPG